MRQNHVARDKILPYFKDRRMDEIKPKDVMEWQNELLNYRDEKGEPYLIRLFKNNSRTA